MTRSKKSYHDAVRQEHYHILKLYVMLPTSPMDYMPKANVVGNGVGVNLNSGPGVLAHICDVEPEPEQKHRRLVGLRVPSVRTVDWNRITDTLKKQPFYMATDKLGSVKSMAQKGMPDDLETPLEPERVDLFAVMWGKHDVIKYEDRGLLTPCFL